MFLLIFVLVSLSGFLFVVESFFIYVTLLDYYLLITVIYINCKGLALKKNSKLLIFDSPN